MSHEASMQNSDQRRLTRVALPDHPRILDAHSGETVGQLVNLSVEGLMMMSPAAVTPGTLMQLRIPLQRGDASVEIAVGVECLWCDASDASGINWMGFHIIDISDDDREIIAGLVYD